MVNDPYKLSHSEVEQMEEPTDFFSCFSADVYGWVKMKTDLTDAFGVSTFVNNTLLGNHFSWEF